MQGYPLLKPFPFEGNSNVLLSIFRNFSFAEVFRFSLKETPPSRQKKKQFLCFVLNFSYLCE